MPRSMLKSLLGSVSQSMPGSMPTSTLKSTPAHSFLVPRRLRAAASSSLLTAAICGRLPENDKAHALSIGPRGAISHTSPGFCFVLHRLFCLLLLLPRFGHHLLPVSTTSASVSASSSSSPSSLSSSPSSSHPSHFVSPERKEVGNRLGPTP